ncbi:MAG: GPW/gp25 family protein [Bacteroidia bacterium]|nr:GPW/gp25 family protein [Bacteroidia bacterium]
MAEEYLKDIQLTDRGFDQQVSDRTYVDLKVNGRGDLATLEGRDNLVQALLNRLLTRQGELSTLGHPKYGSRLHTLIGEPNNLRVRGLADAYIREAIAQEKRILKVNYISFDPPQRGYDRSTLRATLSVTPSQGDPFTLLIPINLEG